MSDKTIVCQWITCNAPATARIVRSNTNVCDEHLQLNQAQFGVKFTVEALKVTPTNQHSEVNKATEPKPEGLICPVCGYYCAGKGGHGCIDKPKLMRGRRND